MLNVIKTNEPPKAIFSDLSIGDIYLDQENIVCIKTTSNGCIYFHADEGWKLSSESPFAKVTPIEADLVIK